MIKKYYNLAKPGIVYGNIFTTLAAFLFACRWHIAPFLLLATIFGLALVIGSACVFNNYLDRGIDRKMARTKDRALVLGEISPRNALAYAILLAIIGLFVLAAYVNILSALVALFGFVFYVAIYGIAKRQSHWGTVVGSISGAVPIVVGYTAVMDRLDAPALILFLILALWQMPHFYAIAMYRLRDYVAAGIPVLPARKGMKATKIYIVLYIVAFMIATSLMTIFGYAGYIYLAVVLILGISWLWRGSQGFNTSNDEQWARKLFFFSLIVLVGFSTILSVAPLLPL